PRGPRRPAVDQRDLDEVEAIRGLGEVAATLVRDRAYAGAVVDVAGDVTERLADRGDRVRVQFDCVDVGRARAQRGQDVPAAAGTEDRDAPRRAELVTDRRDVEVEVGDLAGIAVERSDRRARRGVLLWPAM